MGRSGNPAKRAWQPMEQGIVNPEVARMRRIAGDDGPVPTEAWMNDRYQCSVTVFDDGMKHLSIHTHDRTTVRDWRHLQQIKNEVCGEECEAIEIYPAESRLVDTSNEYHLWVLPPGMEIPLGFPSGMVTTDEQTERFNAAPHKGRQRPWQEGLTTGRNPNARQSDEEIEKVYEKLGWA